MSRRKTGLIRNVVTQVDMTADENEYVSRKSFEEGMSKSGFIRQQIFGGLRRLNEVPLLPPHLRPGGSLDPLDIVSALERLRALQKGRAGIWRKRKPRT